MNNKNNNSNNNDGNATSISMSKGLLHSIILNTTLIEVVYTIDADKTIKELNIINIHTKLNKMGFKLNRNEVMDMIKLCDDEFGDTLLQYVNDVSDDADEIEDASLQDNSSLDDPTGIYAIHIYICIFFYYVRLILNLCNI